MWKYTGSIRCISPVSLCSAALLVGGSQSFFRGRQKLPYCSGGLFQFIFGILKKVSSTPLSKYTFRNAYSPVTAIISDWIQRKHGEKLPTLTFIAVESNSVLALKFNFSKGPTIVGVCSQRLNFSSSLPSSVSWQLQPPSASLWLYTADYPSQSKHCKMYIVKMLIHSFLSPMDLSLVTRAIQEKRTGKLVANESN